MTPTGDLAVVACESASLLVVEEQVGLMGGVHAVRFGETDDAIPGRRASRLHHDGAPRPDPGAIGSGGIQNDLVGCSGCATIADDVRGEGGRSPTVP